MPRTLSVSFLLVGGIFALSFCDIGQHSKLSGAGGGGSGAMSSSGSAGHTTGASSGSGGAGGSGGSGAAGGATSGPGGMTASSVGGSTTGIGGSGGTGATDPGRDYSTNRAGFFGDSRCDVAGLALCDGFEGGAIDTGVWEVHGASPTLDTTRAARGTQSLHVHTDGNAFSYLKETMTFPAANNTYCGRMFVWIDALPTAPDWAHWTLAGAAGSGHPGEIRVGGQYSPTASKNLFGAGTDGGATGDWTFLDADPTGQVVAPPVQDWVCIEWMHKGDTNETRFFWDGSEHPSLHTTKKHHGGKQTAQYLLPTFTSVWVGWWLYQSNPTPDHYDVWIDEVAIDGERIGCVL